MPPQDYEPTRSDVKAWISGFYFGSVVNELLVDQSVPIVGRLTKDGQRFVQAAKQFLHFPLSSQSPPVENCISLPTDLPVETPV